MMSEDLNLISTCLFRDKEYVLSLKLIASHTLDVKVTDKFSGEVWAGSYDCTYIENITHKTGNFKQFDVFLSMLRSGFLKTCDSISLDLLTYEDLEALRSLRKGTSSFYSNTSNSSNKRYLIVTYSVEFDRIHYPLPLDYCGPPNPLLLQATIRKLESEVTRLKELLEKRSKSNLDESSQTSIVRGLEKRINELTKENDLLIQDMDELRQQLSKSHQTNSSHPEMKRTLRILEEQVEQERLNFQQQVKVLQNRNQQLLVQLEECQRSELLLQQQMRQLRPPGDGKGSSCLNVNRRVRIRRNKYQLPPIPDRMPVKISSRSQMMGDGVNIQRDRKSTKKTPAFPMSRRRNQSESSMSSGRSSSVDSCRTKGRSKKGSRERTVEKRKEVEEKRSRGVVGRKNSPVSSKASDKSPRAVIPRPNLTRPSRSYHSTSESNHSDRSGTSSTRKRRSSKNKSSILSNVPKKSSSDIENRILLLQKRLKDSVYV